MTIAVGDIVRASNWPGVARTKFLVREITHQPRSGEVAYLLELDGRTPWRFRAIPTKHLRLAKGAR
jgi:hypothetical protein